MKPQWQVFLVAIAFDIYWTLVVLFRERGLIFWLPLAILAWLLLAPAQRRFALFLAIMGCALDTLWALTGLIEFTGEALLPVWMMVLWLMFATTWTWLTARTSLPVWLLVLLATVGGPAAYAIGEYLGAISFLASTVTVIGWMAFGWLVVMLLFHRLIRRQPCED